MTTESQGEAAALERLLVAVRDLGDGNFRRRLVPHGDGVSAQLALAFNDIAERNQRLVSELLRVRTAVGQEGRLLERLETEVGPGGWNTAVDAVNGLVEDLTRPAIELERVLGGVADGDLSQPMTLTLDGRPLQGAYATLAKTVNGLIAQLTRFAVEVTRLSREIAGEGRLGGQAVVPGVSGTWRDLTDSVNFMADNLTEQVRNIAQVTTAVARGDLTQKINVDARGEILELKNTINTMVDQLSSFADEVTRVSREVGSDGKLGGQAQVPGVAGTWRDLTDSVNLMADNLTDQVRGISQVATAVATGDLTKKIDVDARGEILQLKNTLNTMVDQLSAFAGEVTRVAREVGSEGKLGGQAEVAGAAGTWRSLTDSVNGMADNLTDQVRNISHVTTAVAKGDLTQKITVDARGEILELKTTMNTMVDQLSAFADEVTRVAREVGTEGQLGGQAQVPGVAGTWRDLTGSVNFMANNLTTQVRNIAQVATAVARGDLTQKIAVDARGEILELKTTLNTMVDQLSAFADEVTRVAREVGTEGKLGGQATVPGVAGTWKDLTDNVNFMANNLTDQVRNIATVTSAVAKGDLTQKISVDARGEILELKTTLNTMVDQLSAFADEVTRVAREVGTEGKLGGQATVRGVAGTWKDLTDNVNVMATNLTDQVRSIATVATGVANGDLSKKISIVAQGEVAALAETLNGMVETLRAFADEVTRVSREVGTEGILGGQARVPGVAGTWKDLTENVNFMAHNLTSQVRNISQVTTAVARGDLTKKIDVDARGEILELKTTMNTMVDQLSAFASEVTRVAREVGTEGKLGGQAEVDGVSGTWQRLTESVNQLAGNLTTQVRAIAQVATAVTAGDLTRHITVDASGEVSDLKDNINQMIANLKETTRTNTEQDWLKTNLAQLSGRMQGHRDLASVGALILSELAPLVRAQQGAFFLARDDDSVGTVLECIAAYGLAQSRAGLRFAIGESLIGQAAVDHRTILVHNAPPEYALVSSGLGSASPVNLIVLPVLFQGEVLGVLELASVNEFSTVHQDLLEQLRHTIGVNVNTILSNSRTEALLTESQRLAQELRARSEQLQAQQGELRRSNTELAEKAALLAQQNRDIEVKNSEIEQARQELEERAGQLTVASQYKTEFMANMSHELRTPLNSALILAKLLSENPEGNLTEKQIQFARTIYAAGSDLQQLINDILDLAKVEAGRLDMQMSDITLPELVDYVESLCRPLTADKGLEFAVHIDPPVPGSVHTDEHRLQQILRNLLSNAAKFTDEGSVRLHIRAADPAEVEQEALRTAPGIIAFAVEDTGIGIPEEKLAVIFEAFRQADGTTSRKYGGTGLGLNISQQLTELLGGELRVISEPGKGSTFTLYLPVAASNLVDPAVTALSSPRLPSVPSTVRIAAPHIAPKRFQGEKVLIVDDDLRNVFALAAVLEQAGLEVVYAETGVDGIRALERNEDTALVLMDVMMPELDGNATIAAIRAEAANADLPVIAVTAKATAEDRARTLASGADDYITKPVDTDKLLDVIAAKLEADAASAVGAGDGNRTRVASLED
ncbi:HAMP domain-containing protein [Amycolatopsis sp. WQ 127309]|uniref:HAMP domain-containing protein n=1 Tax=Amycolatopsis sp. WQ 127309 TaxID=2932773 RepID=UPI001FF66F78|nr:HAMP domain-containing protein [Amycolatopsis sp. WQ 127309]UOZ12049.1 HAMP domain-containing protein [Amycolatopsis sp. WQ 127309]